VRRLPFLVAALAVVAASALASEDPIATRQQLMESNGAAAAVAGAILKGELDYSQPVGNAVVQAFAASAIAVGDYFPEGSADAERSRASPKIWEDMPGFQAALAKFQEAAAAAGEAGGRGRPETQEAFAAAVTPVLQSCQACHESYRLESD
jgi:cytochrome c556